MDINCIENFAQIITCFVEEKLYNRSFYLSMVYGSNDDDERKELWEKKIFLHSVIGLAVNGKFECCSICQRESWWS